jgi:hypothetical protein
MRNDALEMPLLGPSHTKQHDWYEGWVPEWKEIQAYTPSFLNSAMDALAPAKVLDNISSVK